MDDTETNKPNQPASDAPDLDAPVQATGQTVGGQLLRKGLSDVETTLNDAIKRRNSSGISHNGTK